MHYPYKFRLEISFELIGNEVKVCWKVVNVDDKTIYFSIGAHPAIALNYELFKGDALVFDDLKSDEVTVCSRKSSNH